jgi:hypothetical protein
MIRPMRGDAFARQLKLLQLLESRPEASQHQSL